jgi:hypothetical protein
MGMPDQLFHEMMKVPSSKIKMLSVQEIKNFSLDGVDPAYWEWNKARGMARWGEQKFKEYEDWADRLDAFVDRCVASAPKNIDVGQRSMGCYDEFLRRYPNPVPDNPG